MKTFKYIITLIFCTLCFLNCSEKGLLDETDLDQVNTAKVYSDVELTRNVLIDLYGRMRELTTDDSGSFSRFQSIVTTTTMLDNVTDDGSGNANRAANIPQVQNMVTSAISPSNNFVAFSNPWNFYYKAIRNANIFLANVDKSPLVEPEKSQAKAQARFLRALYYHELMRWFGPLVISTDIMDPFAFKTTKRENMETTVRFIADEFDAVAQPGVLPDKWDDSNYGRITRGTALGYKARTLLYGASPLYKSMGSTVTWQEAADAANDLISLNLYQLYVDGTTPAKSYKRLFNTRVNSESMLLYLRADNNDLYNCFPTVDNWNLNKEGGINPSQALIDCYDMADGQEPILGYQADGLTPVINPATNYNDATPYINRDPRFVQTILYDGGTWPLVNKVKDKKVDISTPWNWFSGYFLVKYLDDRVDHMNGGKTFMGFQMMRYAEVLLNYAEAINEAADNIQNRSLALVQINAIRQRAGITGVLQASDFTQAQLRERIRKERRIELCFEEHRFFDIRRWDIAKTVMNRPATGITKSTAGQYKRVSIENRFYDSRINFMPIPIAEVNNCPLIYQNTGY